MKTLIGFALFEFLCAFLAYPDGLDITFMIVPWWFYFLGGIGFCIAAFTSPE